jgi:hypothetical protein
VGRGDANFQGINPQLLRQLITSLSGGVSRAEPLAGSYLGQFSRLGLDTGAVQRLRSDYGWAAGQQPMLSRRLALASHQPPGSFTDGMTSQGAGPLTFATTAAAKSAGAAAAQQLATLLAAGDDDAARQLLATMAQSGDDPDYTGAFTDWVSKNDPSLMVLAQPGFAAYYTSLQSWFRSTGTLWASPEKLHDHAWGGPTRSGPPHAPDFGAASQQEYAKLAYQFLADAKAKGYAVKVGGNSVRIYEPATNTFASFGSDGTVRTFFKPTDGVAYWNRPSNGTLATGTTELDTASGAAATRVDDASSWFSRAGRLMDSPFGRASGKALGALGAASDVYTIVDPSSDALLGASTERAAAAANLGAMAVTAGPATAILAANSLDWVPVAGEVVLAATAAYFVGDLVYENRQAIGHALSWTGHETVHLADDVGHGVSHAWHSLFG